MLSAGLFSVVERSGSEFTCLECLAAVFRGEMRPEILSVLLVKWLLLAFLYFCDCAGGAHRLVTEAEGVTNN